MRATLLEPLKLPWELKEENLTAKSGVDELRDGRTKYWVDEILKGITPKMFVWWFSGGIVGDMDIGGRPVSRYRVWHPYDHVNARLLINRPAETKEGAVAELEEYFGRNPEYYTNPAVRVDKVDEETVTTTWFENGIAIGQLDHELEAVPAARASAMSCTSQASPRRWASFWHRECGPARWEKRGSSMGLRRWPTSRTSCRSSTSARAVGENCNSQHRAHARRTGAPSD